MQPVRLGRIDRKQNERKGESGVARETGHGQVRGRARWTGIVRSPFLPKVFRPLDESRELVRGDGAARLGERLDEVVVAHVRHEELLRFDLFSSVAGRPQQHLLLSQLDQSINWGMQAKLAQASERHTYSERAITLMQRYNRWPRRSATLLRRMGFSSENS